MWITFIDYEHPVTKQRRGVAANMGEDLRAIFNHMTVVAQMERDEYRFKGLTDAQVCERKTKEPFLHNNEFAKSAYDKGRVPIEGKMVWLSKVVEVESSSNYRVDEEE